MSGGGGFHTHPQLKRIVEGAYEVGTGGSVPVRNPVLSKMARRSTLNEIPGLSIEFASATHGFLRVELEAHDRSAKVEFYESQQGEPGAKLVRTEHIT